MRLVIPDVTICLFSSQSLVSIVCKYWILRKDLPSKSSPFGSTGEKLKDRGQRGTVWVGEGLPIVDSKVRNGYGREMSMNDRRGRGVLFRFVV